VTTRERAVAGRLLGFRLAARSYERPVVLALSRAARPIALEIARVLGAPCDHYGVRAIGAGALAEDGSMVFDARLDSPARRPSVRELKRAWSELRARMRRLRGDRPPLEVARCTAILVEETIDGAQMVLAAARALADRHPSRLVLAVPACARAAARALAAAVDDIEALDESLAVSLAACALV
jgi:putative phosphoribosyl transferase